MKKAIPFLIILCLLAGCEDEAPAPDISGNPAAVKLIFPAKNSLCNVGTNITQTESIVSFEWEAGENTDEYELNVKNLITGSVSTHQTANTKYSSVLSRATPYAWYVVSKSGSVTETAQSETWKFYNAGEAIESYAPFPADLVSPAMASVISAPAGVVTLDWNGSDVDGDIVGYDLYFGTTTPPGIFESNLTESILSDVSVSSNTIYFWRIITKDSRGNTSDSGISQFKVQ